MGSKVIMTIDCHQTKPKGIPVNISFSEVSKFSTEDCLNPLHPNISIYILHTVLHTFPKELTRRIYSTINNFFLLVIISFILVTLMCYSGGILSRETRYYSLLGVKGLSVTVGKRKHSRNCIYWNVFAL